MSRPTIVLSLALAGSLSFMPVQLTKSPENALPRLGINDACGSESDCFWDPGSICELGGHWLLNREERIVE